MKKQIKNKDDAQAPMQQGVHPKSGKKPNTLKQEGDQVTTGADKK